jgi:8-oxo-dGTP diphosphatase
VRDVVVIVGAAIVRGGKLLAQERDWPVDAAGKWELPGGMVEPGESDVDGLRRECAEELGVDVVVGDRVGSDVPLPGGKKVLRIFAAKILDGDPRAVEHRGLRWLAVEDLDDVDWLPADRELLPELGKLLSGVL